MSDGGAALDRLVADIDYPMYIVTAADGGRRAGCLVGFVTQCSIEPVRLLVCLSKRNLTFEVAGAAPALVVHFLSVDDQELARLFGEQTGDEVDKFASCAWDPGPDGVPVLAGGRGWVAGRVLNRLDAGDHTAFVVEPFAGESTRPDARPLTFQHVRDLEPGHRA